MNIKKIAIGLSTLTLTFGLVANTPVSAEPSVKTKLVANEKIETKDELIQTIKEINKSSEIKNLSTGEKVKVADEILKNATKEAKKEYDKQMMDEVKKGSEKIDMEKVNETGFDSAEITLSDGSKVEYQVSDISESEEYSLQGQSMSPFVNTTKKYGDRRFTATITFDSWGVTVGKISLGTHYTIGDYGLKMRYVSKGGTESYSGLFDIQDANVKVTDSRAEKVGYDINGFGSYKVHAGLGWLSGTKYFELTSTIKLYSLNKSNRSAYVQQSYRFVD
ncbi:hypothetical protein [Rossellomorea aquimaris]|jgi:hypothetical protein|uniref:Uncharacterized protein n=1 Tax=Rossellomorea aquimaris TaxID=189382 RepID=A0A1J6W398_9BACI|nr:hypothetical protein [Rossellomorea aquimaris]OIU71068.1 hypothetical protein BHE18_08460 [Rossellomorea aquimaris]